MKITKCILVISLSVATFSVSGQTKAQKIDKLLSQYFSYGEFNGAALVAEHDKVILKKGYGFANVEWKIPNSTQIKFPIGSVTKTFTDLLAFQQIEKGKLRLEGHISDYLTDYPKPQGEQITIHQLMTNTSGLPDYNEMDIDYSHYYPHEKILAMFDSLPLEFAPGTKFKYSSSGPFVLGVILEKITGKSYEQLLHENILQPLGLKNTGYDRTNYVIPNRASGYRSFGPQPLHDRDKDISVTYAVYGMYSTCDDLYTWSKILSGNKLISEKSMRQYLTPIFDGWACDWVVKKIPTRNRTDSNTMILRGGSNGSFIAFVARILNDNHSIVLLDNIGSTRLEEMISKIEAILYNKPYTAPKQSLQKVFRRLVNEQGMTVALNKIHQLRKDTAHYDLNSSELLKMGYIYRFELNDYPSAIAVFELVRDFYPGNFNPYGENSVLKDQFNIYGLLGDTYLAAGQKQKAVECFKKALELNPKDSQAIEALRKLETK
jgi:CubicO group peptidase (beta-lactamase class C family)